MTRAQHKEEKVQNDYIATVQQHLCHVPMAIYCVGLSEVIIQRSVGCIIWCHFGYMCALSSPTHYKLKFFSLKSTKLRNGTLKFDFRDCRLTQNTDREGQVNVQRKKHKATKESNVLQVFPKKNKPLHLNAAFAESSECQQQCLLFNCSNTGSNCAKKKKSGNSVLFMPDKF